MDSFGTFNVSELSENDIRIIASIDVMFLLLTGMNILFMQLGFLALEVGATRPKSVKSLLFKNFVDNTVGAFAWVVVGYGLFIGDNTFAAGQGATFFQHPIVRYPHLFQQFGFAATAVTIVSGAVTPRMRAEAYLVLALILTGVTYPIQAHWCWTTGGWLQTMGFLDFAGSAVVHVFGGSCALVAAIMVGPRVGRFEPLTYAQLKKKRTVQQSASATAAIEDESENDSVGPSPYAKRRLSRLMRNNLLSTLAKCFPIKAVRKLPDGQDPTMMAVGTLILWFGWFSFNGGSAGSIVFNPEAAARACVNTLICSAVSVLSAILYQLLRRQKHDLSYSFNAFLSGLVAITGPSGYIDMWATVVLGVMAAIVYKASSWVLLHVFGVDDPLSCVSVHASCGVLGMFWLGLVHPKDGLFYGGGIRFLGVVMLGCLVIFLWASATTFLILWPLKRVRLLQYTKNDQLLGIDFMHFSGNYMDDIDLESSGKKDSDSSFNHTNRNTDENVATKQNSTDQSPIVTIASLGERDAAVGSGTLNTAAIPASTSAAPKHPLPKMRPREYSTGSYEAGSGALEREMKHVMDFDERSRKRFIAYLSVMHREEGVKMYEAVLQWKKTKSRTKRAERAKQIIVDFILESAPKQVNLASFTLEVIRTAYERNDIDRLTDDEFFDKALDELFKDHKIAFQEFVNRTPGYWR